MGCERVSTLGGHQRVVLLASERITTAGVHQPFSLRGPAKAPTPASAEGASLPQGPSLAKDVSSSAIELDDEMLLKPSFLRIIYK